MGGLSVDLAKCFDKVPPAIAINIFVAFGLDAGVARALQGFYDDMYRRIKQGEALGGVLKSVSSVVQGDP